MKTYRTRAEYEQEQKFSGQMTVLSVTIFGAIVGAALFALANYEAIIMFIWSLRTTP